MLADTVDSKRQLVFVSTGDLDGFSKLNYKCSSRILPCKVNALNTLACLLRTSLNVGKIG